MISEMSSAKGDIKTVSPLCFKLLLFTQIRLDLKMLWHSG